MLSWSKIFHIFEGRNFAMFSSSQVHRMRSSRTNWVKVPWYHSRASTFVLPIENTIPYLTLWTPNYCVPFNSIMLAEWQGIWVRNYTTILGLWEILWMRYLSASPHLGVSCNSKDILQQDNETRTSDKFQCLAELCKWARSTSSLMWSCKMQSLRAF